MHKSKKLYGIFAATTLLAACQTVDRSLVQQSYLLSVPDNAKAVLLFFSGGYGSPERNRSGRGSLNLYSDLPSRGIGVAFIHRPPDQPDGFRQGFRSSDGHVRDINTVIRYLRKELKLPIWLAGHSSGAVSVANVAINTTERIDGVVFSAADLLYSRNMGEPSVTSMALYRINVPVLAIAHKLDACRLQHGGSMPEAAAAIVEMAENAPVKKVVLIEGGVGGYGNPCTSGYHMYDGARSRVVDAVANFILRNIKAGAKLSRPQETQPQRTSIRYDGHWKGVMRCESNENVGTLNKPISIEVKNGKFKIVPDLTYRGVGEIYDNDTVRIRRGASRSSSRRFRFAGEYTGDAFLLRGKRGIRNCNIKLTR